MQAAKQEALNTISQLPEDTDMDHQRVQRLKQVHDIYPRQVKQRINTTDSNHSGPIFHNYLRRNFIVDAPNQVWVSDLTYIRVNNTWMYLVSWIDWYSRKVTGWAMANHMRSSLMVKALEMGIERRGCAPLLVHSDRGSQTEIFKYIETFYKGRRKHSFLNYFSPDQFEHDTLAA